MRQASGKFWILAGGLALTLSNCGGTNCPAPVPKGTYYLITHASPTNPFWTVVQKGMADAAERYNVTAVFQGSTGSEADAPAEQAANITAAIAKKVDGIAVTISDSAVLNEPIKQAVAAGIPVVAINNQWPSTETNPVPYLYYIGQNDEIAGKMAAQRATAAATAAGKPLTSALCIKGMKDAVWSNSRCLGMSEGLPAGVTYGFVADDVNGSPPVDPTDDIKTYLAANPNVGYIQATSTSVLSYVLPLIQSGAIASSVIIGTVDLDDSTLDAVTRGKVLFAVDQQPYLQGYLPISSLFLQSRFLLQPALDVSTGPFFVTAANAATIKGLVQNGYR